MSVTREQVPEERRVERAAEVFGGHFAWTVEPAIYSFADRLSRDYNGGFWNFYDLGNKGFYLAPDANAPFRVSSDNGFEGEMSADALGITACLYAYSHLSFGEGATADECGRQFHLLREYALDHPEAGAILAAID